MSTENENIANEPLAEYNRPLNADDVWKMFAETDKRFRDTEERFKETDKLFEKSRLEAEKRSKETEKLIEESRKETKRLEQLFTSQWGKLIESLVKGDLLRVLNERNITVSAIYERRKGNYNGTSYEFDLIAKNGNEVVIVEVKTTLRPNDIKYFTEKLKHAKEWMSEYKDNTIYGAVAFLSEDGNSARMAEKKGLFTIRATGNSASIINETDFVPHTF